jgi:hypothetical protein
MKTDWAWDWIFWGGRGDLSVYVDLQDIGLTARAGWRDSQLLVRLQLLVFEVELDVDFTGYVDDLED